MSAPPNGNAQMVAEEKKPKKFLFVSIEGLIGDLALAVKKEGNEVRYHIYDKAEHDVCDGFVDKCDDWHPLVDWADVIIFDDVGFGAVAGELRKKGKAVVGGTPYTDKLEDDRLFGQDELASAGVNVLPHSDFSDFDAAIEFVKKNPGRYVLKPNGSAQNEKELSFIGLRKGSEIINEKRWAAKSV